jgi:hypothetical protein
MSDDRLPRVFFSRPLVFSLGFLLGVAAYRDVERLLPHRVGAVISIDSIVFDYSLLGVAVILLAVKLVATSLRRIPVSVILAIAGLVGLILGVLYVYNLSH